MIVQTRPQMPETQHLISRQTGEGVEAIVEPRHQGLLNRRLRDAGHDIQQVALPLRCGAWHEAEGPRPELADVDQDRGQQADGDDDARGQADEDRTGVERRPDESRSTITGMIRTAPMTNCRTVVERGVAYALV